MTQSAPAFILALLCALGGCALTSILIVDDHWLFAAALEQEIRRLRPEATCTRAGDLSAALEFIASGARIDIVFLDLKLPDAQQTDALAAVLRAAPDAKVAVVSGYDDAHLMRRVFEAGAIGYVQKGSDPDAFGQALELLLSGGFYFPAEALEPALRSAPIPGFTPRESDVLLELAQGMSTKLIARKLGLAPTTVDKHVEQLRTKLGVRTRMQLVARIHELGVAKSLR